jgi:hypothetical protein
MLCSTPFVFFFTIIVIRHNINHRTDKMPFH